MEYLTKELIKTGINGLLNNFLIHIPYSFIRAFDRKHFSRKIVVKII